MDAQVGRRAIKLGKEMNGGLLGMASEEVVDVEVIDEAIAPSAITAVAKAEIDVAIATAHRFPRDLVRAKKDMVAMATLDEETAAECNYSLTRKEANGQVKVISGPSIRMAEIAMACYGNMRVAVRLAGETEDRKFVLVQAVAHDLQANTAVTVEVARRITTSKGKRYGDDMVGVTIAAAGSIARRNAILAVIPLALVKPAADAARGVALGKSRSLTQRRGEVIARLAKLSPLITLDRVLEAVGKKSIEEITWDDVGLLMEMGVAVKDGTPVEEVFPDPNAPPEAGPSVDGSALRAAATAAPKEEFPPVKLSREAVASLLEIIHEEGVSLDAVQGKFGCDIKDITGVSESEITARVKAAIAAEKGQ